MHRLLQKIIHTARRNKSGLTKEKVQGLTEKYESILSLAADEYTQHPPDKNYMDGVNLQKWMRDYKADHLYFLSHPEADYTNNISKRELRKFKRKKKQAVVLRSDSGGRHICDALSIIESVRLRHKNVYDTAASSFS